MQTLRIVVDGLSVDLDSQCDIRQIDTHQPVKAEFIFKDNKYTNWDNCAKVVAFYSCFGMSEKECTPKLLENGRSCIVPSEAFSQSRMKIEIHGRGKDNHFYRTNRKTFRIINGGLYS